MKAFFEHPLVWLAACALLLGACTVLPLRIQDDRLRNWTMRWILVPVSILIIVYVYPVGIGIFKRLALTF